MARYGILVVWVFMSLSIQVQAQSPLWTTSYDHSVFSYMETGFSSDSRYFVYGSDNGNVYVKEAANGNDVHSYKAHEKKIMSVIFQPNGTIIASGDKKGNLVLYDLATKSVKLNKVAHEGSIMSMCFNSNGTKLVTGDDNGNVKIWDVASVSVSGEITSLKKGVMTIKITPDDKKLLIGTNAMAKSLHVFDFDSKQEIKVINTSSAFKFAPIPNTDQVAGIEYGNLKSITLRDLNTDSPEELSKIHDGYIYCVAASPDGKLLVSGSEDKSFALWKTSDHSNVKRIDATDGFEYLVFSPDSRYLATLNKTNGLKVWEVSQLADLQEKRITEQASTEVSSSYSEAGSLPYMTGVYKITSDCSAGKVNDFNCAVKFKEFQSGLAVFEITGIGKEPFQISLSKSIGYWTNTTNSISVKLDDSYYSYHLGSFIFDPIFKRILFKITYDNYNARENESLRCSLTGELLK